MNAVAVSRAGQVSSALLAVVWIVELVHLLSGQRAFSVAAGAGLAAFVLFALLRASGHIRVLFLLVTSASILIALTLADATALLRGFERAQIFGAFLPSVLLLRATVDASPRIDRLREGVNGLSPAQARSWTLVGAHGLGAVLNVGAMAILAPVVARDAGEDERAVLAGTAARGVGTAVMWSPFFVAMAFVSQLVPGVVLWKTMLAGSGAALIGLLLAHLMFAHELRAGEFAQAARQLSVLILPTALMVCAIVACTLAFDFSGLQAVTLVLPVLCAVYLLARGGAVIGATARRTLVAFSRLADELLIVVGATVLGVVVGSAPQVGELAASVTPTLVAGASLLAIVIVGLLGFGQFGLHPMVGASVVVPIIAAGSFGISPEVLVAAAVFAWGLNASVSIWTLPVSVAAASFGVPVSRMYNRQNAHYAVLLGAAGVAYFALLNAWLVAGGWPAAR